MSDVSITSIKPIGASCEVSISQVQSPIMNPQSWAFTYTNIICCSYLPHAHAQEVKSVRRLSAIQLLDLDWIVSTMKLAKKLAMVSFGLARPTSATEEHKCKSLLATPTYCCLCTFCTCAENTKFFDHSLQYTAS